MTPKATIELIRREWCLSEPELERVMRALEWYAKQPNGQLATRVLNEVSVMCGRQEYSRGYADGLDDGRKETADGGGK